MISHANSVVGLFYGILSKDLKAACDWVLAGTEISQLCG